MNRWIGICFLFFWTHLFAITGDYKIQSVIPGYDGEKKIYLLTLFLSYNPTILSYTSDPQVQKSCKYWWPKSLFFTEPNYAESSCDLLWIDHTTDEVEILYGAIDKVREASAIYTITHFSEQRPYHDPNYGTLQTFLESCGYTFLGHWYKENQEGHAIFIKKELFDAAMRTLNYTPSSMAGVSFVPQNNLEKYFKKAMAKSEKNKIKEIDFIYMINLDERPEKFETTTKELERFDIFPYRFSAVNGWNLTTAVFNDVGVKFSSEFGQEKFLGSVYREIEGEEYLGNEILRPNGDAFFSLGMSHGAIGIILSHLSVLQDAYDSGYDTIWVMEDDVEAIKDPNLISKLIPRLDSYIEDWDILFTDTDTKDHNGNHVPCRAVAAKPNVQIETLTSFFQRFYPVSADFSRIGMRYGAYSMIVRRSGMQKILEYFKKYGIFIPYDMDIWLNSDLKMYSVTEDVVSHRAGSPTDNSYPTYSKGSNP